LSVVPEQLPKSHTYVESSTNLKPQPASIYEAAPQLPSSSSVNEARPQLPMIPNTNMESLRSPSRLSAAPVQFPESHNYEPSRLNLISPFQEQTPLFAEESPLAPASPLLEPAIPLLVPTTQFLAPL